MVTLGVNKAVCEPIINEDKMFREKTFFLAEKNVVKLYISVYDPCVVESHQYLGLMRVFTLICLLD